MYDCGSLIEKCNYENDIAKGWAIGMERYKEVKFYMHENNEKFECKKSDELDGYWEMWDNGVRVKCCKMDENHKENGVGYVFEEGRIARVVEFVNGEEVRVIKEFEEKEKMKEYDENGQLVYIGDYCDDLKENYCREGKRGMEIREGYLVYVGEGKKGKRCEIGRAHV